MTATDQTLPGLDYGQQMAYENLHERHFKKAVEAANDIHKYIGYVLRDLEQGKLSHHASRVLDVAGTLVERIVILEELQEVTKILKSASDGKDRQQ